MPEHRADEVLYLRAAAAHWAPLAERLEMVRRRFGEHLLRTEAVRLAAAAVLDTFADALSGGSGSARRTRPSAPGIRRYRRTLYSCVIVLTSEVQYSLEIPSDREPLPVPPAPLLLREEITAEELSRIMEGCRRLERHFAVELALLDVAGEEPTRSTAQEYFRRLTERVREADAILREPARQEEPASRCRLWATNACNEIIALWLLLSQEIAVGGVTLSLDRTMTGLQQLSTDSKEELR